MKAASPPWQRVSLPAKLTNIPAMLSVEEQQYLVWLTAETFKGWGSVVDLGPWLGGSSASLAEGLQRQGSPAVVNSFDLFRWEAGYMEFSAARGLQDGDDFLPVFLRETHSYATSIRAFKQDLLTYAWTGGPIEILFIDAAKSWELTNAILRGFSGSLVPGKSRVVLQDFRHHSAHWLPLIFDGRPDLWREAESIADGWTTTFIPRVALHESSVLATEYSESSFSFEQADRILAPRLASESPINRRLLVGGLYRKALIEGAGDRGRELRAELVALQSPPEELAAVEDVATILVPRGWVEYKRGDYGSARAIAERCFSESGARPVYAVALLGMALLHQGAVARAKNCIDEVIERLPDFHEAKLYRAEVALAESRYGDAVADALKVLKIDPTIDDGALSFLFSLLDRAWAHEQPRRSHVQEFLTAGVGVRRSALFLARLAEERAAWGAAT